MARLGEVERTGALVYFVELLTSSAHVTSVRFLYPGSRLDVTRKQILAVENVMSKWRPATLACRLTTIGIHRIPSLARMQNAQIVPRFRQDVTRMAALAQRG